MLILRSLSGLGLCVFAFRVYGAWGSWAVSDSRVLRSDGLLRVVSVRWALRVVF